MAIRRRASARQFAAVCVAGIAGLFLLLTMSGCLQTASTARTVTGSRRQVLVFAAASLTDVFAELARSFEAEQPGVELIFNFAGSQQLAQQLAQGAPADLFASADLMQMDAAIEAGRSSPDLLSPLATNSLILVAPGDNPAVIGGLSDLARPGVKIVLAAPEVPAGRYTDALFARAAANAELGPQFPGAVADNVVSFEQSVRAVLSKIRLGEADAGIVYTSDVATLPPGDVTVISPARRAERQRRICVRPHLGRP